MPPVLIAQLLTTFGPAALNLIDALIAKWQTNTAVTPDEWATLSASCRITATAHMTSQLQAAGINPSSPQGQALLGLVPQPAPNGTGMLQKTGN